jgi:hypothetical protein
VKHGVDKSASVTVGKNEAVAVPPLGVGRVELHDLGEESVSNGSKTHGGTRVARVGLLDHLSSDDTNGVDANLHEGGKE